MNLESRYNELIGKKYQHFDESVLKHIGERIKKLKELSIADVQGINNIAIAKQDYESVVKELAKITGQNVSDIKKLYEEALEAEHLANKPLYDYRNIKFVPLEENLELQAIVNAYAKTSAETMINISKTKALGFVVNDTFTNMQNAIYDVLGNATMKVATSATDFNSAMREAVLNLGGSGIRVQYGSGVTRSLESVVRQNVLWGAKQASKEYNELIGNELGCDGIEIDWHSNSRPAHIFMQGKQFAKGASKIVNGVRFEGLEEYRNEEGKNVIEALNDYGCLHYETDIICGVSAPTYTPEELARLNAENEKEIEIDGVKKTGYEWQQTMRGLERKVRQFRCQKAGMQGLGYSTEVKDLNNKIKLFEDKYNQIADKTGIKAQYEKMAIMQSKKLLDNSGSGGIMNMRSTKIMNINNIDTPIEQRNTGKGNPNAVLTFDRPLNNRQQKLLDSLKEYDSRISVPKKMVNMRDLSALTAITGDEFALFTKGKERLIVRGNGTNVNIDIVQATELSRQGYKWSGHTHPGIGKNCLMASPGDVEILKCFEQKIAYIYNSQGDFLEFGKG